MNDINNQLIKKIIMVKVILGIFNNITSYIYLTEKNLMQYL